MFLDILGIGKFFWKVIITLVAGIYQLVNYAYQVFLILAQTNIFEQSDYQKLTEKIYVILGVLMMFVIAYNILTFVIDPDKNKSGSSVEKMLKNILISFILIVLCPTIFSYAFKVQDAILKQGIFSRFFDNTGIDGFDGTTTIRQGGSLMATYTFSAFFTPVSTSGTYSPSLDEKTTSEDNCGTTNSKCTLAEAKKKARTEGTFSYFKAFAENVYEEEIDFSWLLAIIAGGYLVYVIISFCFDLAVRVVKLAFYQIIAPICIACRILPDKESIYTNWWKAASKTYIAVFIRVFIMNLGVYLVSIFVSSNFFESSCADNECSGVIVLVAYAFIILGIVTFIRQAFKLIDEIFQLGDVKLGIREKLASGGAFTAGAAIGSGVTAGVRNISHGISNVKKAYKETEGSKGKKLLNASVAGLRGARSAVHGTIEGAYRGGKAGWKAASGADMQKAAATGAAETTARRDAREGYRASHDLGPIKGTTPVLGHIAEGLGHLKDTAYGVGRWAGINNVEELEAQNKDLGNFAKEVSSVADMAKSMLESKAASGKTFDFGLAGTGVDASGYASKINSKIRSTGQLDFSMDNIRKLKDAIADSQRTGGEVKVDFLSSTETFSAAELERIYGKYMSDYSKAVADVAFLSDAHYEAQVTNALDIDQQAALSEIHSAADKARESVRAHLGSSIMKSANEAAKAKGGMTITIENIDGDLKVTSDGALDKIKPVSDIMRGENQTRINEIRNREEKSGDKK